MIADPVAFDFARCAQTARFNREESTLIYLPFLVHPGQLKDFFVMAEELPLAGFSA